MKFKNKAKNIKENKGITLIALVITIIVLLILAGVTIVTLTGDNGILTKAGDAKNTNENAEIEEEIRLAWNKVYADAYLGNYSAKQKMDALKKELEKNGYKATVSEDGDQLNVEYRKKTKALNLTTGSLDDIKPLPTIKAGEKAEGSNAKYTDGKYTAIIPAGFTVSNVKTDTVDETTIETGLVIRDDAGNEFVWIPVGIPYKSDLSKTIELSGYTFDSNGNPTNQGTNTIDSYYTELASSSYGNTVAKDINDFISKTNAAGGFWIGRYEARVEGYTGSVNTSNSNKETSWTRYTDGKLVEKPNAQVFNDITQNKAAELSRGMYKSNYFESDLINSYAWDTATLFLQEYDNRTDAVKGNSNYKEKYSRQITLSSGGLKTTGTNASSVAESNKDKICNVYDMADNCWEWTTATCSRRQPLRSSWGELQQQRLPQ